MWRIALVLLTIIINNFIFFISFSNQSKVQKEFFIQNNFKKVQKAGIPQHIPGNVPFNL